MGERSRVISACSVPSVVLVLGLHTIFLITYFELFAVLKVTVVSEPASGPCVS